MFQNRITVSIAKPCQETWTAMMPQGQGRFCGSCQKTVVDFTAMTDAEVVRWLEKKPAGSCGRFREDQLEREFISPTHASKTWPKRTLFLGLAAWLGFNAAVHSTFLTRLKLKYHFSPILPLP